MMTSAVVRSVLSVPARFRGPEGTANGGWIAGELAGGVDCGGAVEVTLRRPVPLDTELTLGQVANSVTLSHDGVVLAEAIPVREELTAPPFVPFNEAAIAEEGFVGLRGEHPYPGCFVCGTRAPGDGLRIFPGPVAGTGLVAAGWRVPVILGDDGAVPQALVWAALDCPGGWATTMERETYVLGRFTVGIGRLPEPGERCVIMGRLTGVEGRKASVITTMYGGDGAQVAHARATWISLGPCARARHAAAGPLAKVCRLGRTVTVGRPFSTRTAPPLPPE